jgi:hypothetical protein
MAIESVLRSSVNLRLNAGRRESTGGMIVRSISLGNVMREADAAKIMSVVAALVTVLEFPLFRVERQEVTVLEN